MTVEFSQIAILAFASVFAGFIDSVVGGGGLIQIPAIFSVLPKELPATLFGTNKIASVFGTANAAWRYAFPLDALITRFKHQAQWPLGRLLGDRTASTTDRDAPRGTGPL